MEQFGRIVHQKMRIDDIFHTYRQVQVLFQGIEISSPRGRAEGAAPPSANLGPPRISETIRAIRFKFYTHLDRTKCCFPA